MKILAALVTMVFSAITTAHAGIVVSQAAITGQADYGSGTGQSFLLPAGKTAAAIQLHIGSVGSGGGSIFVQLWRATGAPGSYFTRMDAEPVATGTLDRSQVVGTPGWYTVMLNTPFINNTGSPVYLVFDMELLTSGSGGWNNYSYSNQNSYSGGHSVGWSGAQSRYSIRDTQDLTFRILDAAPEPTIHVAVTPAAQGQSAYAEIVVTNAMVGYDYTCCMSGNPGQAKYLWNRLSTKQGTGSALTWKLTYPATIERYFFYVEMKKSS